MANTLVRPLPPPVPTLPRWGGPAAAALVLVLLALQGSAPAALLQWLSDNLQLALALGAGVACVRTAAFERSLARVFWSLIAAGTLIWATAQAVWTWSARSLGPSQGLEVSDVLFFLAAAPFALAAVLRPDRGRQSARGLAFDTGLFAVLVLHAYLYVALGTPDVSTYGRFYVHLMAARGVVVVGAFALLLRGAQEPWRRTYAWLLAAFVVFHLGEAVSTAAQVEGRYRQGLYDLPWTLPFLIIALAAAGWRRNGIPLYADHTPDWRDLRRGTAIALFAVVLVPLIHIVASRQATDPLLLRQRADLAMVTTLALAGLFLFRQVHLLRRLEGGQREREHAVRRSEEQFKVAFHASPAAMGISTLAEGRILDVNARYCELTGYTREELLGRTVEELGLWADPAARSEFMARVREQGSVSGWRLRFRRRSGEVREAESSYERVVVDGQPCLLGLCEDVTDRLRLEGQLRQSQKMEAMGRLASGIAHDFNNLLTAILGYASLLGSQLAETDPRRRSALEIEKAGERAADLTRQLLTFSRQQAIVPRRLDLGVVVQGIEGLLARLIREDISLIVHAEPGLPPIRADRGQIEQVVVNLAVNARDAMPRGGTLRIEVRPAAGGAVLAVRDTGLGMDAQVRARIFEPFFTTKPEGKGTGLGLATVYGIVQQGGGTIEVASEPGRGTTFEVWLPTAADDEGAARTEAP